MRKTLSRVAVIGAGTMGAAIAAHLANAGIAVCLLDVAPTELTPGEKAKGLTLEHLAARNRIVNQGCERCLKARSANPFYEAIHDYVPGGQLLRALIFNNGISMTDVEQAVPVIAETMNR